MPTLTTNANNLTFTAPNQQWIIQSGVVVGSSLVTAGSVVMPSVNDELVNNGIVFMPQGPFGGAGVFIGTGADGSKVTNANTGAITAPTGIAVKAGGVHVTNDGSIVGFAGIGIDFAQGTGTELDNSGYIQGKTVAVRGTVLDGFTLNNSGTIKSDGDGVVLLVTDQVVINNSGTISAAKGSSAIIAAGQGASVNLTNQGVIKGSIELSPGDDIFDGRGGVAKGPVLGDDGDDNLMGGGGGNELHGEGGHDVLNGRGGGDTLIGGADGDSLEGRKGGDDFVYLDVSDSTGNSATTRDSIIDFGNNDVIDVRAIDAKIGNGNQKFNFIGTNDFTGQKGQLRYEVDSGNALVQADVTGDGKADMTILVIDVTKLAANDFNL